MNRTEFRKKFTCVNNNQNEIIWTSPIEARMYVAQNFDTTLCSLVDEDGVERLYEGEIEENRIGFVIIEASDYSFPVEGVDWVDGEVAEEDDEPEQRESGNTQQESGGDSGVHEEDSAHEEREEDSDREQPQGAREGEVLIQERPDVEGESAVVKIETSGRGEVVFSADSINDLLTPAEEVDAYERTRFISMVGVEDPEEAVIMDLGLDEVEVEPIEQIEIIDTGRISDIVEFSQDRYNIDIIPNEITNIPLGTVLLRHDSVVIEGKTYYFSRFQDRSKKKIEEFIERAVKELAAGNIVVEPLTTVLETPKGEVKTYKYFLSEVKEIAGRLRKYSPKVVGVDGEFQLIIGQYWSL